MIYLDANATTPMLPEVLDAMLPWLREGYANPSGSYAAAKLARKAIERARAQVAELIGAEPGGNRLHRRRDGEREYGAAFA